MSPTQLSTCLVTQLENLLTAFSLLLRKSMSKKCHFQQGRPRISLKTNGVVKPHWESPLNLFNREQCLINSLSVGTNRPSLVKVTTLAALECMAYWALKKHHYLAKGSSPVRPSKTKNFLQCRDMVNSLNSIQWVQSSAALLRTWFKGSLSTWLTLKMGRIEPLKT